ncbi:RNA-directed DNA polymerase [Pseudoduganella aquatica]|uniref:RNA-dependent DNA polymerase n=1 Tax=Pseudoduganella aquatica TaxID=2660641 RepID=A0A7X4HB82_9BURK|nr:RNA-directed DNA polymerase [Pseudoduganella aquatica]MYN08054.1 RNA-dependent DNA polymerase [Pseudoduganella aquatica]
MSAAQQFSKEYSHEQLRQLYATHIALTGAIGIDRLSRQIFESRLEQEINLISTKAREGKYKFSQYQEKLISKGANKPPRVISIPTFRDRLTLRALCNVLKHAFSNQLTVKLPQHTISELRTSLRTSEYTRFIKLDVITFYPTIEHSVLMRILHRKIRKPEIRSLISAAIESPTVAFPDREREKEQKGVPQGLSISNILAEIYLSEFDQWARAIPGVVYHRYVDDILVLTKEDPDALAEQFRARLWENYRLQTHEIGEIGKSFIGDISEKFHFLGYEFNAGKASVKLNSIRRIEASIAKILTTYKYRCDMARTEANPFKQLHLLEKAKKICLWRLNLRVTGCITDGVRKGWIFYFSQIDDEAMSQLHHLDKTLLVLARRFELDLAQKEIKSFARTFHEAKRGNMEQRYIPNFDTTSLAYKREILTMYGIDNVLLLSEIVIDRLFKRKIRRETSEMEEDIQGGSRG